MSQENQNEKIEYYPIALKEEEKIAFDEFTARNLKRIKDFKSDMTGKVTANDTIKYLLKVADELEVKEILASEIVPQEEKDDSSISDRT